MEAMKSYDVPGIGSTRVHYEVDEAGRIVERRVYTADGDLASRLRLKRDGSYEGEIFPPESDTPLATDCVI
jgi:hypothetical protein